MSGLHLAPSPHAPTLGARDEAMRFFRALYRGELGVGEWYELRCLKCAATPAVPGPRHYFRSLTDLVDAAMRLRGEWDVFYGVGTRRCPDTHDMRACPHTRRGLDHVARLPALWVDVDVVSPDEPDKHYPTILDALEALHALPIAPDLIVGSGAGLHAYWPVAPTSDLERVVRRNSGLAQRLGIDNCGDAPRILRVPGTRNYKHGAPLPVHLIAAPDGDGR